MFAKNLSAFALGIVVTFGLLLFMLTMTKQPSAHAATTTAPVEITFPSFKIKEEPKSEPNKPKVPPKPVALKFPKESNDVITMIEDEVPDHEGVKVAINDWKPISEKGTSFPTLGNGDLSNDNSATPIIQLPPRYPVKAAAQGKEGYVTLSFTIKNDGSVGNINVVDSQPKRIFNQAARNALTKWKYKPKMINGNAVEQAGQQVTLEFVLEK